ncbi:hypothetical protein [Asticcacaulis machinosus]|uniref:Uncharacterized protein n=1 Tax=Asticcacaulis machinosus TaxID=2984211 RepID=A0ABT5HGJ1_9CAUL|nr:hypothetical protein [Asticcacaulis machinosus]MDC7675374.1 hypothetical protein [Asticcacaulis machinosus]
MISTIIQALKLSATPVCLALAAINYLTPDFALCGGANIWVSMWGMWLVMAGLHVPPWLRLFERP